MRQMLMTIAFMFGTAYPAFAQAPKAIELKLEGFSIRITEILVVTGEANPDPRGGPPLKVAPLAPDKLLHPDAPVWIQFNYETDFKKGDAPESLMWVAVAIHLTPEKPWGYQPARLDKASGKGWIRVFPHHPTNKAIDVEDTLQLVAYGATKNGQPKQIVSQETETVPVKFRRDGSITLSLTQYEELKAGLRKVEGLERKVKELEKRK
jgi:hypothetical protein